MNFATTELEGELARELAVDPREQELVAEVLELHEASELEGFLPLLLGPIFTGLKALAPIVMKAAVPALKSIGAKMLPKMGGGFRARKRRSPPRGEVEAEHEGFLPLIGSLVSGLLGSELEAEHELGRRYVRLARLSGRRAARRIMALVDRGEQPTSAAIRRIVAGAVRFSAESLLGEPARETALAHELLSLRDGRELEHFLGALIGPALSGLRALAPIVAKAAVPMLKSVAASAVPGLAEVAHEGEGEAQELEGFLGAIVGGLLGGELEHEQGGRPPRTRARWFLRVARAASRRAASEIAVMMRRGRQPDWVSIRRILARALFAAAGGARASTPSPAASNGAPRRPRARSGVPGAARSAAPV